VSHLVLLINLKLKFIVELRLKLKVNQDDSHYGNHYDNMNINNQYHNDDVYVVLIVTYSY